MYMVLCTEITIYAFVHVQFVDLELHLIVCLVIFLKEKSCICIFLPVHMLQDEWYILTSSPCR